MSNIKLLMEFFGYGVAAGIVLSSVCAVFGVFVLMKRTAFVGITLAEVAGAGLAGGFFTIHLLEHSMPAVAGVAGPLTMMFAIAATAAAVTAMAYASQLKGISQDAVLGIIFAAAGAAAILFVSHSGFGMEEIKNLLWGNLLVARGADFILSISVLLPALAALLMFMPHLLLSFTDPDLATLMGLNPRRWELAFFYVLGIIVAVGSRIGGSLLVFAYLVAPSAAALIYSKNLKNSLVFSALAAALCTLAGLYMSLVFDAPASQLIIIFLTLSVPAAIIAARIFRRNHA